MSFISFDDYLKVKNNDPDFYLKKIGYATNESFKYDFFKVINTNEKFNIPVIITSNFNKQYEKLYESENIYNKQIPDVLDVYDKYKDRDYIPKSVVSYKDVRKLNFPIKAYSDDRIDDYNTFNDLNKQNIIYNKFIENPNSDDKYEILTNKNDIISVNGYSNKFKYDINLNKCQKIHLFQNIIDDLFKHYKFDYIKILLVNSNNKLYLKDLYLDNDINPYQAVKIYDKAFNEHYGLRIPLSIKNSLFETYVKDYISKMSNDIKLIKPKNAIDYDNIRKI